MDAASARSAEASAWRWRLGRAAAAVGAILCAVRAQISLDRHLPFDGAIIGAVSFLLWMAAFYAGRRLARQAGGAGEPDDGMASGPPHLDAAVVDDLREPGATSRSPRLAALPGPALGATRRVWLQVGLAWVVFTALAVPFLLGNANPLSLLNYPAESGLQQNSLTLAGRLLWLGGLALVAMALADSSGLESRLRRLAPRGAWQVSYDWSTLGLGVAIAVAAVFRFWDLAGVPMELTSDHTEKLKDVALLLGGLRPVFLPNNGGREAMEFYWIALLVKLGLPLAFITLKLGMGIISTLTVPIVFRLGRELGGKLLGLISALILAFLPWHIQITRIGLRIAFSPLFAALALYFTFRALRSGRRNDWLALGLAMGFGLFGYTGFRMMFLAVPIVVLIAVAAWFRESRGAHLGELARALLRPLAGHLAAAAVVAVLAAAPLIRYAADWPEAFWGRSITRLTASERQLDHPPAQQLAINMQNALLMFNVTSDSAWFHSPPGRPALETVGGGLFILGVLAALGLLVAGAWRLAALLPVVVVMLLPSALALAFPNEVPHLSRSAGAIPAVVVLTALPLVLAGRWLHAALGRWGTLAGLVLGTFLFVQMGQNTWYRYFHEYRESYDRSTHRPSLAAKVAQGFIDMGGDLNNVYNVGWDNGWDYRVIGLQLGQPDWPNNLWGAAANGSDAVEAARGQVGDPARKLYLVGGPDAEARVDFLRTLFPNAIPTHYPVPGEGKDFWSVLVPETLPPMPTAAATAAPAADGTPSPSAGTPAGR